MGDCYIVLKTSQKSSTSRALSWDIFFWIGSECSQDEVPRRPPHPHFPQPSLRAGRAPTWQRRRRALTTRARAREQAGTAAIKAVELDEALGGSPVQRREVQGSESPEFAACFKAIEYRKGGVESGLKSAKAATAHEARLLQLKGARYVRVFPVPLAAASLNAGDCFVLDLGKTVVLWQGADANRKERTKATEVAGRIKDETRGASLVVAEQGDEPDEFWAALGGRGAVAAASSDEEADRSSQGLPTLTRVSDASGR